MTPLERAAAWIREARESGVPEPEAMALATVSPSGAPSVRIVLCRGVDSRGLRFFTNYESRKGEELRHNPRAAVVFHWAALGRQLRVEGAVERLPAAESDAYFAERPREHRLSALASAQSRPIRSLQDVRERVDELRRDLVGQAVTRPPFWGGYLIVADVVELWTRGADRLHDRVRFTRQGSEWIAQCLAP
jgi:pyridoxamine 5'-phosphate oxidase